MHCSRERVSIALDKGLLLFPPILNLDLMYGWVGLSLDFLDFLYETLANAPKDMSKIGDNDVSPNLSLLNVTYFEIERSSIHTPIRLPFMVEISYTRGQSSAKVVAEVSHSSGSRSGRARPEEMHPRPRRYLTRRAGPGEVSSRSRESLTYGGRCSTLRDFGLNLSRKVLDWRARPSVQPREECIRPRESSIWGGRFLTQGELVLERLSRPQEVSKIIRIFYIASRGATLSIRRCWAIVTAASSMLCSSPSYKFLEGSSREGPRLELSNDGPLFWACLEEVIAKDRLGRSSNKLEAKDGLLLKCLGWMIHGAEFPGMMPPSPPPGLSQHS
ncbi:hypothetical protein FNV43_RR16968 [Rhamnella rubrinervis]|uniref:Uncharacterized protein n=1 Tax=Rhamnella rubrinervis TaxID=2594499 RepID=A0A8K0ME25_9ROSA|nr:hypothetical protein FNV43_RR16968 [Rhamnella rubrinervis]